jgi:type II secretory pathway predicted ATPase ExeA
LTWHRAATYVDIVDPRYQRAELMVQAADLLAAETAERHRRVILIVDEAHLLQPAQLEELRLLTNAEMDSQSPFAGILLGQPTLRKRLRLGTFAALDQRLALRYELTGMTEQETASYIQHHLELSGRKDSLFADDAIALLHRTSRGIPRQINNLATQALIACYASQNAIVDMTCAQAAVAEVTAE